MNWVAPGAGCASSALSTPTRTQGASGRRHACPLRSRLAACLKPGSPLSRWPADRLSPSASCSRTSAPGTPGWEGRDGPAAGDPAPRVEAAPPPQTTGAHASARNVGSFCAVHGVSGLGRQPQRARGIASARPPR
ncbi:hypothetical protein NDU88_001298 [Pleurodeles waltl]|uniref:Uncharacterized protein n=1 Tax=Pleurodeles waltl TaxID=8319 RepID=A0AAV7SYV0_PLEWA|nr:hypothetical protein NDU88_001298 [Pleurodeles waltl]